MKKLRLLVIGLLLFPVVAFAAEDPNVATVTASVNGSTITYSGTTVGESTAVMCKLVNSKGEEIDDFSSAVDADTFSGEFTVTTNDDYEVRCANYEGGNVVTAKVTITEAKNPDTGDNIIMYVIVGVVGLLGIGAVVVFLMKKKK